ncbi:hypothetical protein ACFU3E_23925 [Streptomyces sp. NPDC057424]|uniref:hypothetical protein n=1 Tax=Streptomyces sp. NPDC057424 TaxID=3346127 RepID=UPI0036777995
MTSQSPGSSDGHAVSGPVGGLRELLASATPVPARRAIRRELPTVHDEGGQITSMSLDVEFTGKRAP